MVSHIFSLVYGEYPDSTVLTVLKWRMITALIGNCWKSRGYRTALFPMRYTQVTFFTMSMLLSGLEIV